MFLFGWNYDFTFSPLWLPFRQIHCAFDLSFAEWLFFTIPSSGSFVSGSYSKIQNLSPENKSFSIRPKKWGQDVILLIPRKVFWNHFRVDFPIPNSPVKIPWMVMWVKSHCSLIIRTINTRLKWTKSWILATFLQLKTFPCEIHLQSNLSLLKTTQKPWPFTKWVSL